MQDERSSQQMRSRVERIVRDNVDDLLRYLQRRVDQRDDAADLLGHTLVALWEKAERIPLDDEEARMWCFGIARNMLREHHRRELKKIKLADELRDHLSRTEQHETSADITAELQMRAQTVRQAVGALDGKSQELITLVHWDGFSIAEAARLLGLNQSTARTRYSRALRRLQKKLSRGATGPGEDSVPVESDSSRGKTDHRQSLESVSKAT